MVNGTLQARPELAKSAINWAVGHLANSRRIYPVALVCDGAGNQTRIAISSREDMKAVAAIGFAEVAFVFEASPFDNQSFRMESRPCHSAGIVVVRWQKAGESRSWRAHISYPAPSVLLTDGFKEVDSSIRFERSGGLAPEVVGTIVGNN